MLLSVRVGKNTIILPLTFHNFSISVATFVNDFGDGYISSVSTYNPNLSQIQCACAGWGGTYFGGQIYCICMGY